MGPLRQEPTLDQIEEIRRLRKEGVGVVRLIKIVGLGRRAIERVSEHSDGTKKDVYERRNLILTEGRRLQLEEGLSIKAIGKRLGIGKTTVSKFLGDFSTRKNPLWIDSAMEDFKNGATKKDIAEKYKVAYTTVNSRLGPSPKNRGNTVLSPECKAVRDAYVEKIKERNLKIFHDKVENNLDSKQLAEKHGVSPKIVRLVCARLGAPFKKIRKTAAPKKIRSKPKAITQKTNLPKRVVVQREKFLLKKEVNTFRPGKPPKRTRAEERAAALKSRISGMISNDRLVRKPPPVTLPRISILYHDVD